MRKIMLGIMIFISLIFVGSVKAAYRAYSIGSKITVAGEQYYVIANSPTSQDYIVALKENPLTYDEITAAGGENPAIQDNYGLIGFEFSTQAKPNDYSTSNAKKVVDGWANDKFSNNELKEVNGYKARLITLDELTTNFGFECGNEYSSSCYVPSGVTIKSWIYSPVSGHLYYTMTPNTLDNISGWTITDTVVQKSPTAAYGLIRPVINVLKTDSLTRPEQNSGSSNNVISTTSGGSGTSDGTNGGVINDDSPTEKNIVNVPDTYINTKLIITLVGLGLIVIGIVLFFIVKKDNKKESKK